MTLLEELLKQALIGTSRGPVVPTTSIPAIDEAIAALGEKSPESTLLAASALLTAYQRTGRLPTPTGVTIEPSAADRLPSCSQAAAQILDLLLASADSRIYQHLISQWLTHAAGAQKRVPHRLLPRMLDLASRSKSLRSKVVTCIDSRGQWLTTLNPKWQFAAAPAHDLSSVWQTGNRDQRLSSINQIRQSNPSQARDLIASTWKEDTADDRATFVSLLSEKLTADDEQFLESALDDKSKQVRAAAADLLTALPNSAFVKRMTERAASLLKFTPPEAGGLLKLKRSKPAILDVTLPPEPFDKSLLRDAITEKPPENFGPRQGWLLQIISYVPPSLWTTRWNTTPDVLIAASGEFKELLLRAWLLAAKRANDRPWLRAIALSLAAKSPDKIDATMLGSLNPPDQLEVLTAILESHADLPLLTPIIDATECDLDQRATLAVAAKLDPQLTTYSYYAGPILENIALRVPPSMYDELANRWADEKFQQNRKALDQFFHLLMLRRDMKREF